MEFFSILWDIWKTHLNLQKQNFLPILLQELGVIGMFFSSFFFCMCMFKLVDAETLVCAILLSCFVLTSPPSPSQCPLIERKTKCQIELSISSLVMLNYTALLGSTSGPSLYFFLESKFWGLSMGRWGMQGRSRAVRQLKDHPAGTGRIPGRERERTNLL